MDDIDVVAIDSVHRANIGNPWQVVYAHLSSADAMPLVSAYVVQQEGRSGAPSGPGRRQMRRDQTPFTVGHDACICPALARKHPSDIQQPGTAAFLGNETRPLVVSKI